MRAPVRAVALGTGAAVLAALAAAPAGQATLPAAKTVKVGDDYFGPTKLTVRKGTIVRWSWLPDNADSHDVKLSSGPKGVKRFHSEAAASDYFYVQRLKVAGTYKIVCTLHQDMTMKITVR